MLHSRISNNNDLRDSFIQNKWRGGLWTGVARCVHCQSSYDHIHMTLRLLLSSVKIQCAYISHACGFWPS